MTIEQVSQPRVRDTIELLDQLRVSLFGVSSHRLHGVLARDAAAGTIDGRVAVDENRIRGIVVAAPESYWRSALVGHWGLAIECALTRLWHGPRRAVDDRAQCQKTPAGAYRRRHGLPSFTWTDPADAWRIVIVGTAEEARGRGVAARLYRSVMADRSLVARIAPDNAPSIRLHESLGWRLYPDGEVVLAVHERRSAAYSADAAAG